MRLQAFRKALLQNNNNQKSVEQFSALGRTKEVARELQTHAS
jgi:hypothetical protein